MLVTDRKDPVNPTQRTTGDPQSDVPTSADVIIVGAGPGGSTTAATSLVPDSTSWSSRRPLPTREGLRRRPDAARVPRARQARHRHLRRGRLAAQQGLRIYGGRVEPFEMPGRSSTTSRTTASYVPRRLRPAARRARRLPAPRSSKASPSPSRSRRRGPHHRRHVQGRGHVLRPAGRRRRRQLRRGSPSRWASPSATTARWAWPYGPTTRRAPHRRLARVVAGAVGRRAGTSNLLPGYGWIFGMGDGTCNVGLGMLNTSAAFGKTDYKALLKSWLDNT